MVAGRAPHSRAGGLPHLDPGLAEDETLSWLDRQEAGYAGCSSMSAACTMHGAVGAKGVSRRVLDKCLVALGFRILASSLTHLTSRCAVHVDGAVL